MESLLMERESRDRLAGKDQLEANVMYLSAIERGDWTTVSAIENAPKSFPVPIMELPRYHRPRLKAVAQKTWLRLGEFVAIAWPILIAGSVGLEVFDYYGRLHVLRDLLRAVSGHVRGAGQRTRVARGNGDHGDDGGDRDVAGGGAAVRRGVGHLAGNARDEVPSRHVIGFR